MKFSVAQFSSDKEHDDGIGRFSVNQCLPWPSSMKWIRLFFRDRLHYFHSGNVLLCQLDQFSVLGSPLSEKSVGPFVTDSIIYIPVTYFSVSCISCPSSVLREKKNPVWPFKISYIFDITVISAPIVIRMSSDGRIPLLFIFRDRLHYLH